MKGTLRKEPACHRAHTQSEREREPAVDGGAFTHLTANFVCAIGDCSINGAAVADVVQE